MIKNQAGKKFLNRHGNTIKIKNGTFGGFADVCVFEIDDGEIELLDSIIDHCCAGFGHVIHADTGEKVRKAEHAGRYVWIDA